MIVDVEASHAVRQAEVAAARTMLERTDQLELANLTALSAQPRTKKDEQTVPKARSNIAKELLQSRQRGSAGVSDGKSPLTTSAWLAPR